jgi:hypothetical protein
MYVDVIPITSTLFDYLEKEPKSEGLIRDGVIRKIKIMEPGEVVPFLKEHLKWRIVDPAANLIDGLQQIKDSGLEVKVVQRMFETPNDTNKLGVYSDPVLYCCMATYGETFMKIDECYELTNPYTFRFNPASN